jgi:hypothetical protein
MPFTPSVPVPDRMMPIEEPSFVSASVRKK